MATAKKTTLTGLGTAFGAAKTKKERETEHRERVVRERLDTRSRIDDYVIARYRGRKIPVPTLERAKDFAKLRGSKQHPVTVIKYKAEVSGCRVRIVGHKVLYRYPE